MSFDGAPVRVTLKTPHEKQRAFIESPAKRKIIRAGRRSGKTSGCAILSVREFLKGGRVLYAAPTEEQTGAFWSEVRQSLVDAVAAGVFTQNLSERFIEKPGTSARIKATTAWSADTLRSDWASLVILDEFQLQAATVWDDVCAPMLLDTNGDCVLVYTPISLHSRTASKAEDPRHAAKMFKAWESDRSGRYAAFHFTSHDNPHISRVALSEIAQDMTQLAIRQEILAEDVEEIPGALWTQKLIDENRVESAPELSRVVVGVDPSGGGKDVAGIVVCGVGRNGHGYILNDASLRGSPQTWGSAAVRAYHAFEADRLAAEENFGGEMVKLVLLGIDPSVSYRAVHASRGKLVRAEPIAAQYERGRVHHVGAFPALEEELTTFAGSGPSPGRLDALVWALTELLLNGGGILGVIGFYAQHPEADLCRAERQSQAVQVAGIEKTNEASTPAENSCPKCGASLIQRVANSLRCAQCGHQFGLTQSVTYATFGKGGTPALFQRGA